MGRLVTGLALLRLLVLLLSLLFLRLFGGEVMADGTAGDRAEHRVVVREMARNGAHRGAFQAPFGLGGRRGCN